MALSQTYMSSKLQYLCVIELSGQQLFLVPDTDDDTAIFECLQFLKGQHDGGLCKFDVKKDRLSRPFHGTKAPHKNRTFESVRRNRQ